MDSAGEHRLWRKYYINVCRPLNPVPGCDRFASACQMKYVKEQVSRPALARVSVGGRGFLGTPRSEWAWPPERGLCVNRPPPRESLSTLKTLHRPVAGGLRSEPGAEELLARV